MTDPSDHLDRTLTELRVTVGALTETVKALQIAVEKTVSADRFDSLRKDVESLVSLKDWAIRLVIGAVILALLGLILVQNGGAP